MLDPVQPLEYETGLLDDYALCLSDIARHPRSSSSLTVDEFCEEFAGGVSHRVLIPSLGKLSPENL